MSLERRAGARFLWKTKQTNKQNETEQWDSSKINHLFLTNFLDGRGAIYLVPGYRTLPTPHWPGFSVVARWLFGGSHCSESLEPLWCRRCSRYSALRDAARRKDCCCWTNRSRGNHARWRSWWRSSSAWTRCWNTSTRMERVNEERSTGKPPEESAHGRLALQRQSAPSVLRQRLLKPNPRLQNSYIAIPGKTSWRSRSE